MVLYVETYYRVNIIWNYEKNILCIVAPDDEALGVGGTLLNMLNVAIL